MIKSKSRCEALTKECESYKEMIVSKDKSLEVQCLYADFTEFIYYYCKVEMFKI